MLALFKRVYLQFLILVALMLAFAFLLDTIFSIGDTKLRILFTALFLLVFSLIITAIRKAA